MGNFKIKIKISVDSIDKNTKHKTQNAYKANKNGRLWMEIEVNEIESVK